MMQIILPKTFVNKAIITDPLFFVAGPVQGGAYWQEKCCIELSRLVPSFFAVVPCRWRENNALFRFRAEGIQNSFTRQVEWEYYYLKLIVERAKSRRGCLLFWLPKQSNWKPRVDGLPYGVSTQGELGRWGATAALTGSHIVVGAEPDFPNLRVIRENLRLDFGQNIEFPISPTLEETVRRAAQWVQP